MSATYFGPYGIHFEFFEDEGLLVATMPGDYVINEDISQARCVLEEAMKVGVGKLLVAVLNGSFRIDVWPAANRFKAYEEIGIPKTIQVAWLVKEMERDHWFYETMVRKHGWNIRVRDTLPGALAWLEVLCPPPAAIAQGVVNDSGLKCFKDLPKLHKR